MNTPHHNKKAFKLINIGLNVSVRRLLPCYHVSSRTLVTGCFSFLHEILDMLKPANRGLDSVND